MNVHDCLNSAPPPGRMTEEEFVQKQTDLLNILPYELRSAVSYYAYEKGHSGGREEILGHVQDLVEMLNLPLVALLARVKKTH